MELIVYCVVIYLSVCLLSAIVGSLVSYFKPRPSDLVQEEVQRFRRYFNSPYKSVMSFDEYCKKF